MKPVDYLKTLKIPAGRARMTEGNRRIAVEVFEHPANKPLVLSNFRTTIVGGQKDGSVTYKKPTTWRRLIDSEYGTWMSDLPIEQKQHYDQLKDVSGRILVGGLGLGLAASILCRNPKVTQITIVELNSAVIHLVGPTVKAYAKQQKKKLKIVQADLHEYLQLLPVLSIGYFDYGFYDIWQSDGEGTFFDTVVPLWKQSEEKIIHPPICWNEDVMRGQLKFGLISRYQIAATGLNQITLEQLAAETDDKWIAWSVPFFKWIVTRKPDADLATLMAPKYADLYGTWGWEEKWKELKWDTDL